MRLLGQLALYGGALVALSACQPHGRTDDPAPDLALPSSFGGEEARDEANDVDRSAWWLRYDDPELHRLMAEAMQSNLSLRARWVAIEQARALAMQAAAARYPTVAAQGRAGYGRNISAFATTESITLNASLPVAYEVDLFGRWRGNAEAADLEVEASRQDLSALALSTSAQLGESWYSLVDARARRELLQTQHETDETFLELVRLRFEQGLASALDVHQQRLQSAASQQQLDAVDAEIELAHQQLALLLGRTAADLQVGEVATFPELGPSPPRGPPADIVWARPDVQSAQTRVRAADWRVGSAIAARLPSVRLDVTPGYSWQRNELSNSMFGTGEPTVAHGFTFNAGATLTVPLFDGFAGRGGVEAQRAALQQQVEVLQQTVLGALLEVEGAIVQEAQQRQILARLEEQHTIAGQTLESARDRYRGGLSDFLPVLTALQAQHRIELSLQLARRQLISRRIQLHRALGGDWPESLERPDATPLRDRSDRDQRNDS